MFAADMVVTQKASFLYPIFNDFLHARAERDFTERHRGSSTRQIALDFQADLLCREPHLFQNHEGDAIGFTEYRQDEVLGPEVIVLVPLGFLTCEDDDLSTFIRESFEHPASF